jgi:hypothetical protein
MKKILFCLFILIACSAVKAQLANQKWIGTLQLDQAVDVLLDFKKDTVDAISTGDGRVLETMLFTAKDNMLTLKKVYGQSDCGGDVIGKYKFELKDDSISLMLVEDECFNRSSVLDKTKWNKQK